MSSSFHPSQMLSSNECFLFMFPFLSVSPNKISVSLHLSTNLLPPPPPLPDVLTYRNQPSWILHILCRDGYHKSCFIILVLNTRIKTLSFEIHSQNCIDTGSRIACNPCQNISCWKLSTHPILRLRIACVNN